MDINQISAAFNLAINQGASADLVVVGKIGPAGSEKQVNRVIYIKGDMVLAPSQSAEADRIVIEFAE